MHRSSCFRLRLSTEPNVLIVLIRSSLHCVVTRSPREESNLCARGRSPLLFRLSYGGVRAVSRPERDVQRSLKKSARPAPSKAAAVAAAPLESGARTRKGRGRGRRGAL